MMKNLALVVLSHSALADESVPTSGRRQSKTLISNNDETVATGLVERSLQGEYVKYHERFATEPHGHKRLLVIVMNFREDPTGGRWGPGTWYRGQPQDIRENFIEEQRNVVMPQVKKALEEMSYRKLTMDVTVTEECAFKKTLKEMESEHPEGKMDFKLFDEAIASVPEHNPTTYDMIYVQLPRLGRNDGGSAGQGRNAAMCWACFGDSIASQVETGIHELGHTFGLAHSGTTGNERYGNIFDLMRYDGLLQNMTGRHFGLGSKVLLGWIDLSNLRQIDDTNVNQFSEIVEIHPYDKSTAPAPGEIVGVKISLSRNGNKDIYISYKSTFGDQKTRGVFIEYQDNTPLKTRRNSGSTLMDAACGTDSALDAKLRADWNYVDPSRTLIVKTLSVSNGVARVEISQATQDLEHIQTDRLTDGEETCARY